MVQLEVGDVVRVAEWFGVISEILKSEDGRTFLRVQSPRNIHRRMVGEFIEVDLNPSLIRKGTMDELYQEVDLYRKRFEKEISALIHAANKE